MTRFQRIKSFITGLVMIAVAIFLVIYRKDAYPYVLMLLSLSFLSMGLGALTYYFTMTRYMVGGKLTLYKGVILIDFAILSMSLADVPGGYVLLYLAVIHAFSGLVEILRSLEAKRNSGRNWKLKLFHGILDVFIAICCIRYIRNVQFAAVIYSTGLVYSGIIRMITAFRKTTLVYIP